MEIKIEIGKIEELVNPNELRRLEKAAKDKNKMKLAEWAGQFEQQVINLYEKKYQKVLGTAIDSFFVALVYTLHFNENCKFGDKRVRDFMQDLVATVQGFEDGQYSPEEYREILKSEKVYYE